MNEDMIARPETQAGQVWHSSNVSTKFYILCVFPDGSVSLTTHPLVPGHTGIVLDYTKQAWDDIVLHSALVLEV